MSLNGMYRRSKTGEANHCRQDHIYRSGLHYLVQSLTSGIDLYVGLVAQGLGKFLVMVLIGDDDGGRMELLRLLSKQLPVVVCRQGVSLIEVDVGI